MTEPEVPKGWNGLVTATPGHPRRQVHLEPPAPSDPPDEWMDRNHPLQYGFRGSVYVASPGADRTVKERYNRCPTCEQWSPCDVRKAWRESDWPETP